MGGLNLDKLSFIHIGIWTPAEAVAAVLKMSE
jgi:hypothetical protein